ncbi:MAG: PepSY domain-containing protein, partial [Gemmatimonadaceae bacterium]|nr:PepSY domain-containing protein [Acetobacteraceae bacterium]
TQPTPAPSPSAGASPSTPSTSSSPAAVATTSEPVRTTEAPVPGANSFTEGQARSRIEERGFAQVTDLKKDDQGVWRGTAMKDGKSVTVAMDYQGNIVGQ